MGFQRHSEERTDSKGGSDVRDAESPTGEKDLILNVLDLRMKNRGYKTAKVTA